MGTFEGPVLFCAVEKGGGRIDHVPVNGMTQIRILDIFWAG
jgi:hypothetical protein